MPPDVLEVTKRFMRDPIRILVKKEELTLEGIKQFYVQVEKEVSIAQHAHKISFLAINNISLPSIACSWSLFCFHFSIFLYFMLGVEARDPLWLVWNINNNTSCDICQYAKKSRLVDRENACQRLHCIINGMQLIYFLPINALYLTRFLYVAWWHGTER